MYKLDSQYITLFAGTAPNLIPSFLFTLIGIFYIVPFYKGIEAINKSIFIYLINVLNIVFFILIEYLHVVFKLGKWDDYDIVASLIGIGFSAAFLFQVTKGFYRKNDMWLGRRGNS
ncbi:hypothetical protein Desdi_0705 [Desulfitobacterium dichloroeliminans LMG P-21439]|uniref:Uncharacterized protein n=1 Tax=Desulfitobacterium dichloroeliminans (strain LMG P-21439 / DCA1) TaxID=871963 RepID=L0F4X0_DESDL|nr:hypothetical protein [Desulfitobacterium dichloroeliminans]AGA68232.1 hypothetical protein Desdi_0705 [Desulfitobacterium dichloroeliminans LMG P-21439]